MSNSNPNSKLSSQFDSRPIGVFDSGIGGLTVLRELIKNFPDENFLYLGDTARLPYGSKSAPTVRKYSEQNMNFLVSRDVKAIIVACNTASTQISENIFSDRNVYNVIGPGSALAVQKTKNKKIAVLATAATVKSDSYKKNIQQIDPDVSVVSVSCPLFVPLAEEGWHDDPITEAVANRYLQELKQTDIDTVVLGCTHYPLLKNTLQKIFANHVSLIDSGEAICDLLKRDFQSGFIQQNISENNQPLQICLTDFGQQFESIAIKLIGAVTTRPIHFETVSVI
jgi:glutamate racemase